MKRIVPILILALLGCACSQNAAPLVASDVVISKPIPGMNMTAGYLTLSNNASQKVIITQVTSPQFESVEMHESVIEDGGDHARVVHEEEVPRPTRRDAGQHILVEGAPQSDGAGVDQSIDPCPA